MNTPSMASVRLCPGMATGVPSLRNLPIRAPSTMTPARAGDAADGMHHRGTGKVDIAMPEVEIAAQLRQPAAAPHPVAENRVEQHGTEQIPRRKRP